MHQPIAGFHADMEILARDCFKNRIFHNAAGALFAYDAKLSGGRSTRIS